MNSVFQAMAAGRRRMLALGMAGLLLAGCDADLNVPDFNNPSLEDLQNNPTPTLVRTAATGLLVGGRSNIAGPNAYVSLLGILGRESYNFDGSEPRFVTEMLVGPMSPSGAFGGNLWAQRYRNIQNANLVLAALDQVSGFSEAEKEAIRGFAKTMQALDLLLVINTRDTNGAVIDNNRPVGDEPGPLENKQRVMERIAQLLDEAAAHLRAGGSDFPFALSSGFDGFNTPPTFLEFNRALRARVAVYRGNYQEALQALQGSFVDRAAPLAEGVYHTYGTGSGETDNDLIAVTLYAHPSVRADAQQQPGGELDRRVLTKTEPAATPGRQQGIGSDLAFSVYQSNSDPVPIIRNEELLLLRAEARWFTGDRAGALEDLNFVRQQSGGLAPIAMPAGDAAFVDALLYERRFSLLFEGGHRWIDARRFNRLDRLPRDLPSHVVHARFPIPEAECLARGATGECAAG
jgi:hypothetical protein